MATDKELSQFSVNEVDSDEKLNEISRSETLGANQIFVTKDGASFDNAVGLPIGTIFASAIPQVDARVHLLDGSYIAQDGIYEEFAELIKSLDASGRPIACSEDDFETDVANTGNCGKFVINSQTRTIRLPRITTFIQGLSDISNIGSSLSAGLPNINAQLRPSDLGFPNANHDPTGAFTKISTASSGYFSKSTDTSTRFTTIGFDASRSNSIYGNSDTVQPQATQFPYYIVLASGYKSKKSLNIDNIMEEVRRKPFIDNIYPVGSIFLSLSENFSPARAFGGTWERIKDCFLWGSGDTQSITYTENGTSVTKSLLLGKRGGEISHKLTISEMPSHNHPYTYATSTYHTGYILTSGAVNGNADATRNIGYDATWTGVGSKGGSGSHNNMPPYMAVYMWQRLPDDENGSEVENYPYYGDGSGGEVDNY